MSVLVDEHTKVIIHRMTAATALTLALLPIPLAAEERAMVAATDPIALIEQVCLGDQVRLSPAAFKPASYAELSSNARQVLGFGVPEGPIPSIAHPVEHDVKEVANQFFEVLPENEVYLMLPAAAGSAGATAETCAVMWRGKHYGDALSGMRKLAEIPDAAQSAIESTGIPGLNFATVRANGLVVGAAEFADWTILRVAPDTSVSE